MNDMLGTPIQVGDVCLWPGGNARYGGLKMIVGVVTKLTAKRVSFLYGPLVPDGKDFKTGSKTGAKVLVFTAGGDMNLLNSKTVLELLKQVSAPVRNARTIRRLQKDLRAAGNRRDWYGCNRIENEINRLLENGEPRLPEHAGEE